MRSNVLALTVSAYGDPSVENNVDGIGVRFRLHSLPGYYWRWVAVGGVTVQLCTVTNGNCHFLCPLIRMEWLEF